MGKRGPKPRPVLERTWEKVDIRGPGECWPWTGLRDNHGYGIISGTRATRVILGLVKGNPLFALHKCDNPPCCNPAHLEPGTQQKNMADMCERGRSPRGELRANAKLTADDIHAIRADPRPCTQIAPEYGTSRDLIQQIKRLDAWTHVPVVGTVVPPRKIGYAGLSPRQLDVLRGLARGLPIASIAREMGIAAGATRTHMQRMFRKLGASDETSAVELAHGQGWLWSGTPVLPSQVSEETIEIPESAA